MLLLSSAVIITSTIIHLLYDAYLIRILLASTVSHSIRCFIFLNIIIVIIFLHSGVKIMIIIYLFVYINNAAFKVEAIFV